MATDLVSRVKNDPNFIELEAKRNKLGWTLALWMLGIYYGFVLIVAFAKPVLAVKIYSVVTLAFPIGLGVILSAIIITGIYVSRANSEFDALTRKIVENAR